MSGAAGRRAARAFWPGRKVELAAGHSDDLSATTTPAERFEMVWRLTLDAWALTGK